MALMEQVIYLNALTFALNLFETRFKTFEIEALSPFMSILLKNGAKRTRTADPLHAMQGAISRNSLQILSLANRAAGN